MATNEHATTEELLEAVFSVAYTAAIATQWCDEKISAATTELQE
jgi:hypothetical protein